MQRKSVIESIWEAIIGEPSSSTLNSNSQKKLESSKLKRKVISMEDVEGGYNNDDSENESDLDSLSSNDSDLQIVRILDLYL